jgi:hypothetical protein
LLWQNPAGSLNFFLLPEEYRFNILRPKQDLLTKNTARMREKMSETRPPLARLVLFLVCLALAGSIIAGVYYYAVELPLQNSRPAPQNVMWNNYEHHLYETCQMTCRSTNSYEYCREFCIPRAPP